MNKRAELLLEWYFLQARDLPWRETKDPYAIWISEVILQQTRVAQGLAYYKRFLEAFPDVHSLAEATPEEVLKQWQGLGYYSRARNLHQAARQVVTHFGGEIPETSEGLRQLKGIGDYTAAAIASIAFGEEIICVDGNVNRFISRLFGLTSDPLTAQGRKGVLQAAKSIAGKHPPGILNQSLMEFGAIQCIPRPDCNPCPLRSWCEAYQSGMVEALPVRKKKPASKNRYFYYAVAGSRGSFWVRQRGPGDIWEGLYEFPLLETEHLLSPGEIPGRVLETWFSGVRNPVFHGCTPARVHALTHQRIHAVFCRIELPEPPEIDDNQAILINLPELFRLPVSRLTDRYLHSPDFIPPSSHG